MTFVSYTLWPLLPLLIVTLWFAATLDIVLHSGGETFTNAKLLCIGWCQYASTAAVRRVPIPLIRLT